MRKLEMKEVSYTLEGNPQVMQLRYKDSMLSMLRRPSNAQQGGVDYEEMERVLPIIKKLREAKTGSTVLLEEAEWKELKDRAKTHKWGISVEEIFEMVDYILNVPMEPVPDTAEESES